MTLQEHLEILGKRKKSKIGDIIAAYEVKRWPIGRLQEFIKMGVVTPIDPTNSIKCPLCTDGCPIDLIAETDKKGEEHYSVLCAREGKREIEPFYRERWQITDHIARLVKPRKKRQRRASSELSKREQQVYAMIHSQGLSQAQAAIELGCSQQNVNKHLLNSERKIKAKTSRSINMTRAKKLPTDKREQEIIPDQDQE